MSWITSAPRRDAELSKPAKSLEFPTLVSARGIAPANAVIEHLTTSECRFRTVVFFDHGDGVEFEFGLQSGDHVRVRGSVISRAAVGPRFVYQLRLDRMSAKEIDALARARNESHRRQAMARSHEQLVREPPTTERLTRSSVRVLAQFPVVYRTPKSDDKPAKAGDISSGGLLMTCGSELVEGMPVELRFTLPSDVLKVYPEETVAIDLHAQKVRPSPNDPRRPFEEMVVGARVVTRQPLGNGLHRYGLAFTGIDGFQREEIARYAHAAQRAKNRH